MTATPKRRGPGRPKGSGAKGGKRQTVRLSDRAAAAVKAEHERTGKPASDVIGGIVETWTDTQEQQP